ncbi:ArsR/SmtB family transcription factor [Shouchella shacheensis]|uniref:ArsR/SmtB family transcription factor n=1 Tax=Shouchella shacheensis TaxID=1649580 RepID=UPI00073FED9E|nr:helix-turn-helix domain-containing protein [Shouchella shacheensis]
MLNLSIKEMEKLRKVTHALSTTIRLEMIQLLSEEKHSVHHLASLLSIPVSTAASNVNILEEAGLILTELRPASRGTMKVCTRNFDDIHIALSGGKREREKPDVFEMTMPIGHFTDFQASPTCGMASAKGHLIPEDEPVHFYQPVRTEAQLIWARKGFFEYKFPLSLSEGQRVEAVRLSVELCSEAPNYDHNWPSDITVWMNGVDIGTWMSPGDFGDRPGKLNSTYWAEHTMTQYGTLKTWEVTKEKVMVDNVYLSSVNVGDLGLGVNEYVTIRIGIKEDALHKGGINLFGREFGDHAQDIKLQVTFSK